MPRDFEIADEITLAATPEQVWDAIATGPGVDSWFMGRTELEPGHGGTNSLDMTGADRELIVRNCQQCDESCIVITHGTDTMVETARALAAGVQGKTIVLTGAMIPYAFGSSDGLFNLGSALSLVQVLPPGVYIAMNGRHFEWDKVRKNRETGVFEAIT